ncbi:uncharacterized protein LOC129348505 [Amphiprion ocellaris]|uniref:uncharacterized protein LOC129348505 n=1 Tax=Amphiprion ocellaris TaxID=80972 RepID=UPI002411615C|nr:uncharacterized protein LOC129348505 [Amphiprion ocellaris]
MQTIAKLKHEMCVLSRQVTAVSQELQEMTRLLKPLLHTSPSLLLLPVTPPPSVSSHGCSPAPPLLTQHAPVGPPSVLPLEPALDFDPLRCPGSPHSAPPSLHGSPHDHPPPLLLLLHHLPVLPLHPPPGGLIGA